MIKFKVIVFFRTGVPNKCIFRSLSNSTEVDTKHNFAVDKVMKYAEMRNKPIEIDGFWF